MTRVIRFSETPLGFQEPPWGSPEIGKFCAYRLLSRVRPGTQLSFGIARKGSSAGRAKPPLLYFQAQPGKLAVRGPRWNNADEIGKSQPAKPTSEKLGTIHSPTPD